jgi:putative endonuclease
MHFTYIIESETTQKWYYGSTSDLTQRLENHNNGLTISTRNRGPWRFIFVRPFETKKEAAEFEQYLKKTRNKVYIKKEYTDFFL